LADIVQVFFFFSLNSIKFDDIFRKQYLKGLFTQKWKFSH